MAGAREKRITIQSCNIKYECNVNTTVTCILKDNFNCKLLFTVNNRRRKSIKKEKLKNKTELLNLSTLVLKWVCMRMCNQCKNRVVYCCNIYGDFVSLFRSVWLVRFVCEEFFPVVLKPKENKTAGSLINKLKFFIYICSDTKRITENSMWKILTVN